MAILVSRIEPFVAILVEGQSMYITVKLFQNPLTGLGEDIS